MFDISKLFASIHKYDMHDHRNESYVGIIKFLESSNLKDNIKITKSFHKNYLYRSSINQC